MSDEEYMREAMVIAEESGQKYGHSIGAVIVRDGKIVMRAHSIDNNHHAELNCVQNLLRHTGRRTLDGCILYTTQEPCSMCFGAALYANIEQVVFGAYASDMPANNDYEVKDFSLVGLAEQYNRFDGGKIKLTGGVLREECRALTADHSYWLKEGFTAK